MMAKKEMPWFVKLACEKADIDPKRVAEWEYYQDNSNAFEEKIEIKVKVMPENLDEIKMTITAVDMKAHEQEREL
jgi:hypothetical protein